MHEATQSSYEPTSWLVVFHTSTAKPWLDRLLPGRFKHVSAMAWCEAAGVWLFYEPNFARTQIYAVPEPDGTTRAALTMRGNTVLRMPVSQGRPSLPRLGFWCVPAISHLLGIRGGALPTSLYRACLRAGATIVSGQQHEIRWTRTAGADAGRT